MRPRHLALLLGFHLASCTLAHNPDLPSLDEESGDGDFGADGGATGSGGHAAGVGGGPMASGGHPSGGAGGIGELASGGHVPGGFGGEP